MLHNRSAEPRLVPGEPEAVNVMATYTPGQGWSLIIGVRRQFETWADASQGRYDYLTTAELVSTLDAVVCTELRV
jgi:hypothetical protein